MDLVKLHKYKKISRVFCIDEQNTIPLEINSKFFYLKGISKTNLELFKLVNRSRSSINLFFQFLLERIHDLEKDVFLDLAKTISFMDGH